jgi:hypothetical protein
MTTVEIGNRILTALLLISNILIIHTTSMLTVVGNQQIWKHMQHNPREAIISPGCSNWSCHIPQRDRTPLTTVENLYASGPAKLSNDFYAYLL